MTDTRRRGEPRRTKTLAEAVAQNGTIGLFVAELALRDGRVREAAEAVGFSASYGRTLLQRYPEIRDRTRRFREEGLEAGIAGWRAMHARAQTVIAELMEHTDPRIKLDAAKVAIERNEGRPRQAMDVSLMERQEDEMASIRYRFAHALFMSNQGYSLEAALQYADEHPDQVQEWWELVQENEGVPTEG